MSFDKIRRKMEQDQDKLHKARLARCIPVAKKIVALIGSHAEGLNLGDTDSSDESFIPVTEDILKLYLAEDVHWVDRDFVMQLVMQAYSFPQQVAKASLDEGWNTLQTGAVGKDIRDLTMGDVDNLLKAGDKIEAERDMLVGDKAE